MILLHNAKNNVCYEIFDIVVILHTKRQEERKISSYRNIEYRLGEALKRLSNAKRIMPF